MRIQEFYDLQFKKMLNANFNQLDGFVTEDNCAKLYLFLRVYGC